MHLTRQGLGAPELATLFVWATMPWTFKFLMGPAVDAIGARPGRRRWIIAGCEIAMAASLMGLGTIEASARTTFLALVFVHNLFAALQDVATDGLAIAILAERERGKANGIMAAAKFAGSFAGGALLMRVEGALGWTVTIAFATALTLAPSLLLPFAHEPRGGVAARALLRELRAAFRPRATWLALPFALLSAAPEALLLPVMFPLMRNELRLTDERIGNIVALSTAVQMAAAIAGGHAADRWGRRRTVITAMAMLAVTNVAFAGASRHWNALGVLLAFSIASAIAAGLLYSSTLALFMDLTDAAVAATQFQVFMALLNVPLTWAPKLGGVLSAHLPTPTLFLLSAAIALVSLAVLPRGTPRAHASADAQ